MTPNEKRRAGFPLAALRSMTTDDNRLRVVAAYERDAECRALRSLARWAKPNESALSDWSQGYNRALKDVADECKWRAKKGKR